ncbi:hypothetical protein DL98DRAFT_493527 [Cadophora sp. DSE1049]|nr:hypothetical protein DL98DRAFT_493527 [Cadophora sp. DSE1049]
MDDMVTGVKVYNKVTVSSAKLPKLDIQLSVVRTAEPGNIAQIGPKTIGGHTWKKDEKYLAAVRSWNIPSDLLLGPCILFAWVGSFKKLVLHSETPEHQAACWTAQLLGIVDYDIDFDEKNMKGGIEHVAVRTAKMAAANEGKLRGAGWAGLMVMDQQMFNRDIQMRWAKDGKGSFVIGPGEISPYDFAVAGYVDCAGLPPFAYQSAAQLPASRTAMFVGTLFCNMHDLIYDMGCSSRISAAAYAYSTGVFEFDIPQAWVVGMIDKVAKKSLAGIADQQPLAGEDALMVVCVWNAFNVRYRAWERVIKYSRLLRNSKSKVAAGILERAEENLILVADSLDVDIGKAFEQALDPSNASKLVSRDRYTIKYVLKDPVPVLIASGVESPKLCEDCYAPFLETFNLSNDVIQAIQSIPEAISNSIPVSIAAAIRRGCLFGASPVCCDDCACVIGLWANLTSEKVVISLMDLEPQLLSKDFMAMMYFIGCVAFHPLRIMSVLAGFDLNADITFVKGAMGERDVVDC